jgi:hypothetical protein
MADPYSNMSPRMARRLYDTTITCDRVLFLPRHVSSWIEENFCVLWDMYSVLDDRFQRESCIFDKADFSSFCACIARLSTIDSPLGPHGLAGGRSLVYDFTRTSANQEADRVINTQSSISDNL